jgi:hypothetical protein
MYRICGKPKTGVRGVLAKTQIFAMSSFQRFGWNLEIFGGVLSSMT